MPRVRTRNGRGAEKPKILLTFVGCHDPFRGEHRNSGDGPVLTLLGAEKFTEVRLFYNNDEFLGRDRNTVVTSVGISNTGYGFQ
jgi:hypothetical protein